VPKYTVTQTITAFTSFVVEAENGEIAESLVEEHAEEVDRKEERVYPEGSIRWIDHQQTEVTTDREWTSLEIAHLMADRHAQGVHEDDPAPGCYDCWAWTHGYGERVLELLTVNHSILDWEWWHSGGGLHGIAVQKGESFYFIGSADSPNVGMDISEGEGLVGHADFGSLEDETEEAMSERIWQAVWNGKGVVN
jgi:hypothetical protein